VTRVLVVDDYPAIVDLIRMYIRKTCLAEVDTCHSGQEALVLHQDHRYDVIISDYDMRGMNGLQLLMHLKKSGDRTPFILMTGLDSADIAREAEHLGAVFISKGDHPTQQFSIITRMIQEVIGMDGVTGARTVYS
jgi:DNA-binding NtrC family response regulator